MATDVKVPTLGESITEATIGQWLKKPGDTVALDEPIASLETDKVSVEVPAPVAGTLAEQLTRREIEEPLPADFAPRGAERAYAETAVETPELSFFNGLGGFADDGATHSDTLAL